MKSRWYLIYWISLLTFTGQVFSQTKTTSTGAVKTSSDEYNRQLEKCKVDAQVTPIPNSSSTKTNTSAGSQKVKSE